MPRRKSLGEINSQFYRITERLGYSNSPNARARWQRAERARNAYERNIAQTRAFRNDSRRYDNVYNRWSDAYQRNDYANSRRLGRELNEAATRQMNRQYSQRTYMGLNNG